MTAWSLVKEYPARAIWLEADHPPWAGWTFMSPARRTGPKADRRAMSCRSRRIPTAIHSIRPGRFKGASSCALPVGRQLVVRARVPGGATSVTDPVPDRSWACRRRRGSTAMPTTTEPSAKTALRMSGWTRGRAVRGPRARTRGRRTAFRYHGDAPRREFRHGFARPPQARAATSRRPPARPPAGNSAVLLDSRPRPGSFIQTSATWSCGCSFACP